MKAQKVRDLDENELKHQLQEMDEQLFRLQFQMSMGQMDGLKKIRAMTGEGSVVARIDSLTGGDAQAKAGVMIRDSTAAGAIFAAVLVSVLTGVYVVRYLNLGPRLYNGCLGGPGLKGGTVHLGWVFDAIRPETYPHTQPMICVVVQLCRVRPAKKTS